MQRIIYNFTKKLRSNKHSLRKQKEWVLKYKQKVHDYKKSWHWQPNSHESGNIHKQRFYWLNPWKWDAKSTLGWAESDEWIEL